MNRGHLSPAHGDGDLFGILTPCDIFTQQSEAPPASTSCQPVLLFHPSIAFPFPEAFFFFFVIPQQYHGCQPSITFLPFIRRLTHSIF